MRRPGTRAPYFESQGGMSLLGVLVGMVLTVGVAYAIARFAADAQKTATTSEHKSTADMDHSLAIQHLLKGQYYSNIIEPSYALLSSDLQKCIRSEGTECDDKFSSYVDDTSIAQGLSKGSSPKIGECALAVDREPTRDCPIANVVSYRLECTPTECNAYKVQVVTNVVRHKSLFPIQEKRTELSFPISALGSTAYRTQCPEGEIPIGFGSGSIVCQSYGDPIVPSDLGAINAPGPAPASMERWIETTPEIIITEGKDPKTITIKWADNWKPVRCTGSQYWDLIQFTYGGVKFDHQATYKRMADYVRHFTGATKSLVFCKSGYLRANVWNTGHRHILVHYRSLEQHFSGWAGRDQYTSLPNWAKSMYFQLTGAGGANGLGYYPGYGCWGPGYYPRGGHGAAGATVGGLVRFSKFGIGPGTRLLVVAGQHGQLGRGGYGGGGYPGSSSAGGGGGISGIAWHYSQFNYSHGSRYFGVAGGGGGGTQCSPSKAGAGGHYGQWATKGESQYETPAEPGYTWRGGAPGVADGSYYGAGRPDITSHDGSCRKTGGASQGHHLRGGNGGLDSGGHAGGGGGAGYYGGGGGGSAVCPSRGVSDNSGAGGSSHIHHQVDHQKIYGGNRTTRAYGAWPGHGGPGQPGFVRIIYYSR